MKRRLRCVSWLLLACCFAFAGCVASPARQGALLLIGGGLDDDQAVVYRRFVELAELAERPAGAPLRLAIVTAATGPEAEEATDKTESLRVFAPSVEVVVLQRATTTAATVAAIDAASGLFFTGGDQQRITDRYRQGDTDGPEYTAMLRLLRRGGVIAGASAGCAMMGEQMFLGGSSARALAARGAEPPLGPRLAAGMRFQPWLLTDSHFFERDRLGRLVAGLEAGPGRFGLGVGEAAAVEIDLASGVLVGVTEAESLLVDARALYRDGAQRRGLRARLVAAGDRVALRQWMQRPLSATIAATPAEVRVVPVVEPGQNRQLASWRLCRLAAAAAPGVGWSLPFDGWSVLAWPLPGAAVGLDVIVDA
ncbi:MAG: hypothetical protein JNN13_13910 [Planctomycetes bacterium]|nr:hypothetical protein [Planctomycetota bacterium]